ncbi:hypothetical protein NEHOM01_1243 [Nematocida homosporus]|uniref:uncharacterized protein n=1 Tax=Nematocida homosporus TaxID=1912981 RepID=UPI00221FCAF2|nr:uncharacterized protein NEHOM01_1243 [Nematocida homosporus]KAI5186040.1 hypothetical protein NEHOM01_1243 [Nematocida homosporus]
MTYTKTEQESITLFCALLRDKEREEVFDLLIEYSYRIDRLAALYRRSEEYKLLLSLSKEKVVEGSRHLDQSARFGALAGIGLGMGLGCLSCLLGILKSYGSS